MIGRTFFFFTAEMYTPSILSAVFVFCGCSFFLFVFFSQAHIIIWVTHKLTGSVGCMHSCSHSTRWLQTHVHTQTHTHRQTDRHTDRHTHTHTHGDRHTRTDRHTHRHTQRQTHTHRHTHRDTHTHSGTTPLTVCLSVRLRCEDSGSR